MGAPLKSGYRILVQVWFESDTGQLPGVDEIAQAVSDAFLARVPGLWEIRYPAAGRWWDGLKIPFPAKAGPTMHVYRKPGDATPYQTITDGRALSVSAVQQVGGVDWWCVWPTAGREIWVRAEECAQI